MRRTIEISVAIAVTVLVAMAFHAWLASHDEQLRMQATLTTQKQLLDAADTRERDRTTVLTQTLAQIHKTKNDTQTPEQILRELPKYLALPQPITLTPSPIAGETRAAATDRGKNRKGTTLPSNAAIEPPFPPASTPDGATTIPGHPPAGSGDGKFSDAASSAAVGSKGLPDGANQSASVLPSAQIPAADLKPLYDYVQDCRACQAQLAVAKQNRSDDAVKLAAMTRERDAAVTAAKGGTFWRRFRRNIEWFAVGAGAGAAALCASGHCR